MKNEERIIELLIEALQKVEKHQLTLEKNQLTLEKHQLTLGEHALHWKEQNDTNQRLLHLLEVQVAENQKLSVGLTQNDLVDHEQSKRIEMLHQTWLDEQQVIRDMLSLLMAQNKALKDNNLL